MYNIHCTRQATFYIATSFHFYTETILNLQRQLLYDTSRSKIREKGLPGPKTPLVLKTSFNPDLEVFLVSDSRGSLLLRGNASSGVPSAFFPLNIEDEDSYHAKSIEQLYAHSLHQGWGNVTSQNSVSSTDLRVIEDFFQAYELDFFQAFCSFESFQILKSLSEMQPPSKELDLDKVATKEHLHQVVMDHFIAGTLNHRPVYYNPHLGPYVVFSSASLSVGFLTRIGDSVSVIYHNAERGLVIIKLEGKHE